MSSKLDLSQSVIELFEAQVKKTPSHIALSTTGGGATYRELDQCANRVAHYLISQGVTVGDGVGFCLDRGMPMIAVMLGILKVGAFYVPMDVEYPDERIQYMAQNAAVKFIFVQENKAKLFDASSIAYASLEKAMLLSDLFSAHSDGPFIRHDSLLEKLIYIIYTSGSTGKPKGAGVYHKGFVNLIAWYVGEFDMGSGDTLLHMTSPAFDLTQKNIYAPLLVGGKLCLLEGNYYDANKIANHIECFEVTRLNCTPSAFSGLVYHADGDRFRELRTLKTVFLGGEPIQTSRLLSWKNNDHCQAEVVNSYGPTECTDVCVFYRLGNFTHYLDVGVPIGRPVDHFELHILDENLKPVAKGEIGELCVGGLGVGAGYFGLPELTEEKFINNPFGKDKIYRTGDSVRWLPSGNLGYLGRIDQQVKVRGFRIELGEVERALENHPEISSAAVSAFLDKTGENRLVAYLVSTLASKSTTSHPSASILRAFLQKTLPDFMLPTSWLFLAALPMTPNGKLDRKALPKPSFERPDLDTPYITPLQPSELFFLEMWQGILALEKIGLNDRFFELGGTSVKAIELINQLQSKLKIKIPIVQFFRNPTLFGLTAYLWQSAKEVMAKLFPAEAAQRVPQETDQAVKSLRARVQTYEDIAIIGMAGRFPGAADLDIFWENLKAGVESIQFATNEDLLAAGVCENDLNDPLHIKAYASLDDVEYFDAGFFGIMPREAELMDPQHRLFLEMAWSALDNAGYSKEEKRNHLNIGVYGGIARDAYLTHFVARHPQYRDQLGDYQVQMGNDKNFPATRVAYKLNLSGPALNIQTACSSSGVALHLACLALKNGECDMALVGGGRVLVPTKAGYRYVDGGAFDEQASGMVRGSGMAFLLLKPLQQALKEGDPIRAVIKGTAINNDGSDKAGYTAPSIEGQRKVILSALAAAEVSADSIQYVEAHGTGTALGDPIEIAALTAAYGEFTDKKQFCRVGSVKTNIGHIDAGAAVAGIIKTVLSLEQGFIPATLNFNKPNPHIDFESTPFVVNAVLSRWPVDSNAIRRAGVSSFGLGGTNAHIILEEAPHRFLGDACEVDIPAGMPWVLIPVSAKTEASLCKNVQYLSDYAHDRLDVSPADLAYSVQEGRLEMVYREALIVSAHHHAQPRKIVTALSKPEGQKFRKIKPENRLVFMFPGQGAQHAGMARALYAGNTFFRKIVDECCDYFNLHLKQNLRTLLFGVGKEAEANETLRNTQYTQPALFTIEYALAKLLLELGFNPFAMIGHSIGDYVSACIAGVMSPKDAAFLVVKRAECMQAMPQGSMLAIREKVEVISEFLPENIALAAVNAPQFTVVAGEDSDIQGFISVIEERGFRAQLLKTSHAFHSPMMDKAAKAFLAYFDDVTLHAPRLRFVSSLTGKWIEDHEATSPLFWTEQILKPVLFNQGLNTILAEADSQTVFIEMGPGNALATFAKQSLLLRDKEQVRDKEQADFRRAPLVLGALPHSKSDKCSVLTFLEVVGQLWCQGFGVKWGALNDAPSKRIPLPAFQFDRKRYWLDLPVKSIEVNSVEVNAAQINAIQAPSILSSSTEHKIMTSHQASNSMQEATFSRATFSRATFLRATLRRLFAELSGIEMLEEHDTVHFLELGLDSLFLTQVASELKAKFSLDIRFRELMDELSTVQALAEYLDRNLPAHLYLPEAPQLPFVSNAQAMRYSANMTQAVASTPTVSIPSLSGVPGENSSLIAQVINSQMQLMSQQLALLQGQPFQSATLAVQANQMLPVAQPESPRPELVKESPKAFGAQVKISKAKITTTDAQHQFINAFINNYVAATKNSKEYTAKYRKILADPRVVSGFSPALKELVYPIVVERSLGSKVWDIDGREYVDMTNGFGATLLGHNPPFIQQAMQQQLQAGIEIGPQSPLAGEVAELFCELTANERVVFCNTGSEAVLGALRLARTVTGRKKVVMFNEAYHGINDEVIVRAGGKKSVPAAAGINPQAVENIIVLEYGNPESLKAISDLVNELAAVIVEPVQSRNLHLQPAAFLLELRKITEKNGVAFIMDEVITGFRAHLGGAQAYFGIKADIATYGKVLGGGMPIGAIAGKAKFMDALDGGFWQFGDQSEPEVGVTYFAGTFVRHPLTMAAAKATLLHLKEQGSTLQENTNDSTKILSERFQQVTTKLNLDISFSYFSSAFRINFPADFAFQGLLYAMLRLSGIHIAEGRTWFVTTALSSDDFDHLVKAFEEALVLLLAEGLIQAHNAVSLDATKIKNKSSVLTGRYEVEATESQKEIWASAQFGQEASCAFNESITLTFEGHMNEEAFAAAVHDLTCRHHILQTRVSEEGEHIIFDPTFIFPYEKVDISHLEGEKRQEVFRQFCRKAVETPFDLINGPLGYIKLIKLEAHEYRCIVTLHHIIMDGWSMSVLVRELGDLYTARLNHRTASLPQAPQFYNYVAWQQNNIQDQKKCQDYWLALYANEPAMLNFPTDRPHAIERSFKGMRIDHAVPSGLLDLLKKLAIGQRTSMVTLLYSAFVAYVHRLTEQEDIIMGILSAGHLSAEMPKLVGHCVNVLSVRNSVQSGQSFQDFLTATKATLYAAYDHQNFTYGSLISRLKIKREPGRVPLMPILFNVDQASDEPYRYEGVQTKFNSNPRSFENFEISFNVESSSKSMVFQCTFNTDLFDEDTIKMRLKQFETWLSSVAANVVFPIEKLNFLPDEERDFIVNKVNHTRKNFGHFVPFTQLISAVANEHSLSIAASCQESVISYESLEVKSKRLAVHLLALKLQHQQKIGVLTHRSIEMLISVLGALKAGACYVPLDPEYPEDRLQYMIEDSGLTYLLTDAANKNKAMALVSNHKNVVIIVLDEHESTWNSAQNDQPLAIEIKAQDAAYMIYTSGSTGKPKGVVIPHEAVTNFLLSMQQEPGLNRQDKLLAITTLSFDIAVLELYLPLITGAQVVIADRKMTQDAQALTHCIEKEGITLLQATPTTWRSLVQAGWEGSKKLKALCGGEALDETLASVLLSHCKELWNMYGPTETTVWSTCFKVESASQAKCIGKPIANTQIYILNARRMLVPVGVAGELYIGGSGLAVGYHERDLLTEERFINVPIAENIMRLYRTGDRAILKRDGNLVYMNRIDNQVKLRGFRIELGEIESTLLQHESIENAAVIIREVVPGDFRLIAYFSKKQSTWVAETDLRKFLSSVLPRHMVPQHFVEVASIPLTPNKKVDRKALQQYGLTSSETVEGRLPKTPNEKYLASVWCEVVGTTIVHVYDNFFDVGGHSLLFMKVIIKVEKETGVRLSPNALILYTLEQIAAQYDFKQQPEPAAADLIEQNIEQNIEQKVEQKVERKAEPNNRLVNGVANNEPPSVLSAKNISATNLSTTKGFFGRLKDKLKSE